MSNEEKNSKQRVELTKSKKPVNIKKDTKITTSKEVSNVVSPVGGGDNKKPKTKGNSKKVVIVIVASIVVLLVLLVVGIFVWNKIKKQREYEQSLIVYTEQTSGYAIDNYMSKLNSFNLTELSEEMGNGCYIDDELLTVNNNPLTEEYIRWVCTNTSAVSQNYTSKIESYDSVVTFSVSMIDYSSIATSLDSDKILTMMAENNLNASDLDFSLRIQDVFCKYMLSLEDVPKTTVYVDMPVVRQDVVTGESPYFVMVADDKALDYILFCSDEFHGLLDSFGKVAVGWTGTKMESYIAQEEQENPEYIAWLDLLNQRIEEYPTWSNNSRCLYEPYYLRDENGHVVKDEDGNKVVEFYVLFEPNDNGKKVSDSESPYGYAYIPEPEHTIMVDVEREREVEDPWIAGDKFPYSWVGYWYIVDNGLSVRYGDGSQEYPLGKGAWCPTKLTLLDGSIADAEIELLSWYRGTEAVQYALDMSEKNRGLDSSSVVELVICEFRITNLSDNVVVFNPDMVLVDEYGSKLSRTGTVYGLSENVVLNPGESTVVIDWCTSTDMGRYQVAWGRSFDVSIPMIFFDVIEKEGSQSNTVVVTDEIISEDSINEDGVVEEQSNP